jgi:hypothetical protein
MDLLFFFVNNFYFSKSKNLFPQTEAANFFEYEIERLCHTEN